MRVADYLMSRLADAGLRHIFLLPGGGAMHLNDALACEKRLTAVPCHHEQAAAIAAEAYGRTGAPGNPGFGVVMVTTGPGATNAITPVAGAWIDSVPMLVISGQVKRADRLAGRPLRQGGVQEVDIVPMVRGITKYAVTLDDPAQVKRHLDTALRLMLEGRPGPVWLDVPLDIQAAVIDPATLLGSAVADAASMSRPEPAQIERIMALLSQAERPLLLAGHGVRLAGAAEAFRELYETWKIPVVTTWNALDLIPYDHPLCVGRPGVVALRAPNFAVQNCDLLIVIGCRLDPVVTAYNPASYGRGARKVVIDIDPNELAKAGMCIDVPMAADAKTAITALLAAGGSITIRDFSAWRARCQDWKARYPVNDGLPFSAAGPISHYQFVDALSEALPPDIPIATGSSGLGIEAFYSVFRNKTGQRVFLTSGLGAMGYGLPAAIGACIGHGNKPMVAVESDGSLMLNLQELAILKGRNLPIRLFVLNNGGYASIRNTQRNYFQGRFIATGAEGGLDFPDLGKVAESFGLPVIRIMDAAGLEAGLRQAMAHPGPLICDVRLISDETLWPKAAALPQPDGSMLSMPLEDMSPLLPLDVLRQEMIVDLSEQSIRARASLDG
jgi:acetolactate synthase I/II/III large subunit